MNYNKDAITLQDCIHLNEFKEQEIVINDGRIIEITYGGLENGNK